MATLRESFHSVSNIFQKIFVILDVNRLSLEREPLESLSKEKLKKKTQELIQALDKIEESTTEANSRLNKIKENVYTVIDPYKEFSAEDRKK